jgi:hypothetical protein
MTEENRRRWTDHLTPSHCVLTHLSRAIQTAIAIMVGYLLYLAIIPQHSLSVDEPIVAEPRVVQAGGSVTLSLSYQKNNDSISDLGLFLASEGRIVTLPASTVALPAGVHRLALMVPVPRYTPPGNYKLYLVRDTLTFFPQHPILVESTQIEVVAPKKENACDYPSLR